MNVDGLEGYPLLKIHGSLDSLSSADRRLAEYILDNPRETIDATIEELAGRAGASYATISRFCKKLGYAGYKEFKKGLIDDVVRQKEDGITKADLNVKPGLSVDQTIGRISRFSERVLRETETFLDPAQVSAAAKAMLTASAVLFVGAGTSAITARYAYTRFWRIGIPCSAEPDPVVFTMRATTLTEEDVLCAVSSSGRTASVVEAAKNARAAGSTVISISDYAISPLNRVAEITLFTTPRTANNFLATEMPLLVGQILIVDALFGVISTRAPESAGEIYRRSKDAADRSKL